MIIVTPLAYIPSADLPADHHRRQQTIPFCKELDRGDAVRDGINKYNPACIGKKSSAGIKQFEYTYVNKTTNNS